MADDETDDALSNAELTDRIDTMQSKIDQILNIVTLGGGKQDTGKPHTQAERTASVQEQVRAELERKAREEQDAADKESAKAERQSTADRLSKLEEKPPVAPQPRRQRVMWGKR